MRPALATPPTAPPASSQKGRACGPRAGVLARYEYSDGPCQQPAKRVLVMRDGGDIRQLWDEPERGPGPMYLIEPAAHTLPATERDAIVGEYLRHACQIGHPPMRASLLPEGPA